VACVIATTSSGARGIRWGKLASTVPPLYRVPGRKTVNLLLRAADVYAPELLALAEPSFTCPRCGGPLRMEPSRDVWTCLRCKDATTMLEILANGGKMPACTCGTSKVGGGIHSSWCGWCEVKRK